MTAAEIKNVDEAQKSSSVKRCQKSRKDIAVEKA